MPVGKSVVEEIIEFAQLGVGVITFGTAGMCFLLRHLPFKQNRSYLFYRQHLKRKSKQEYVSNQLPHQRNKINVKTSNSV